MRVEDALEIYLQVPQVENLAGKKDTSATGPLEEGVGGSHETAGPVNDGDGDGNGEYGNGGDGGNGEYGNGGDGNGDEGNGEFAGS